MKLWGSLKVKRGRAPKIDPHVQEAYEDLKQRPEMTQVPMELIANTINQVVVLLMANTWTHVAQNFLRQAFQREFSIFETDVRKLTDNERNAARESAMRHALGGEAHWPSIVRNDIRQCLEKCYLPWKEKHQASIPVSDAQRIDPKDCPGLIRWMADLSAHRDACAAREDVIFFRGCMKQHRLIPLGSLKVRHILINATILKEELLSLEKSHRHGTEAKVTDPRFEDYFPGIEKLKPCKSAIFADYFATDGVSASLLFKKPVSVAMSEVTKRYKKHKGFVVVEGEDTRARAHPPQKPQKGQRLIALDPGRRDVVFGSVHGSTETVRMSTEQLVHDSGRRWSKRHSQKVFAKVPYGNVTLEEANAQLPSSKTASLNVWKHFLDHYIPMMQVILDTWKKKSFRKTAFWCYGKRDQCLDALCKRITGGIRGTLVAFGGSSCSTGCGYAPAPQKRLRTRLTKIYGARVSIIRETYTSQICSRMRVVIMFGL